MDHPGLTSALISIVISFIPIGGLIWKAAGLAMQIAQNKKDIDGVSAKLNNRIDKVDHEFDELGARLSNIEKTVARIEGLLSCRQD